MIDRLMDDMDLDIAAGIVGEAAAIQFLAWMEAERSAPEVRVYLDDPSKISRDIKEDRLHGLAAGLSHAAGIERTKDLLRCADRLKEIGRGAYGIVALRDHISRFAGVVRDPGWSRAVDGSGPGSELVARVMELARK
jgi:hypothetical protein